MSTIPKHLDKLEEEYKCLEREHIMVLNGEEWTRITDIEIAIRKAKETFNRTEKENQNGLS